MSTVPYLETIKTVEAKIAEHHELVADYAKDVTLATAKEALAQAEAAKVKADQEDESVDPAELVDLRFEAARELEVAKIRVDRAERAQELHGERTLVPLHEARQILADTLRDAAAPMKDKALAGAERVFGQSEFIHNKAMIESAIYRMGERVFGTARRLETGNYTSGDSVIQMLNQGVEILKEAHRDR